MAPLASVRASRAWQRLFFAEAERSSAGRDAEASPLRWAPCPSPPHLPFLNRAHPSSPLVPSRKPLCRETAPVLGPRDRPTVSNRLGTSPAPTGKRSKNGWPQHVVNNSRLQVLSLYLDEGLFQGGGDCRCRSDALKGISNIPSLPLRSQRSRSKAAVTVAY